jgi:hypothetical protein
MSTATNPMPYGAADSLTKREIIAAMLLQGIMTRDPRGMFNGDDAVRDAIATG